MKNNKDIAAISTASGVGAVAVIRISGDNAQQIADKVFRGNKKIIDLKGYTAAFGTVSTKDGKHIDECVALNFVAPKSFTGENMVEITCHGGTYISKRVLNAVIEAGASPADAGEFTKRAFLNGKIDLAQAESVIELIHATGERTREAALYIKEGRLSRQIDEILSRLTNTAGDLSAWADYPDDDVPQVDEQKLFELLKSHKIMLENIVKGFDNGKIYRDGVKTVIAGMPNVGKSTVMNLLSGYSRSIVTDIAGTTRDIVEETVMLGEIPLVLADTAGIRQTDDPIEAIGVGLAREKINSAELVIAVFDSSKELEQDDFELIKNIGNIPCIAIINKSDLDSKIDIEYIKRFFKYYVYISARDEKYLTDLEMIVEKVMIKEKVPIGTAELCTARQRDCIARTITAVSEAISAAELGFTLDAITINVEEAIASLLELTGKRVSDTLVDNVFSRFCVGK